MKKRRTTSTMHNFTRSDRKNKKIIQRNRQDQDQDQDYDLVFALVIHRAEDLDPPNQNDVVFDRTYFLVWWILPGIEFWAPFPEPGRPFDPAWKRMWNSVTLDRDAWPGFVHVEVMRRREAWEEGTSGGIWTAGDTGREVVVREGVRGAVEHGITSVSRCRIPLPEIGVKRGGRYGLVKSDGVGVRGGGNIYVTMELKKCKKIID